MGIKISITNSTFAGKSKTLNQVKINNGTEDDTDIRLDNVEVNDEVVLLENLEINLVMQDLKKEILNMDPNSLEYARIRQLLLEDQSDRYVFLKHIVKHLGEFSQGVLASIVANHMTM